MFLFIVLVVVAVVAYFNRAAIATWYHTHFDPGDDS